MLEKYEGCYLHSKVSRKTLRNEEFETYDLISKKHLEQYYQIKKEIFSNNLPEYLSDIENFKYKFTNISQYCLSLECRLLLAFLKENENIYPQVNCLIGRIIGGLNYEDLPHNTINPENETQTANIFMGWNYDRDNYEKNLFNNIENKPKYTDKCFE